MLDLHDFALVTEILLVSDENAVGVVALIVSLERKEILVIEKVA